MIPGTQIITEIRIPKATDGMSVLTKKYIEPLDAMLGLATDLGFIVKKQKNKIVIG